MSTASDIIKLIERGNFSAYTLTYGYGIHTESQKVVHFPPGKVKKMRRLGNDRVSHAIFSYQDGSHINYTYRNERPCVKEVRTCSKESSAP